MRNPLIRRNAVLILYRLILSNACEFEFPTPSELIQYILSLDVFALRPTIQIKAFKDGSWKKKNVNYNLDLLSHEHLEEILRKSLEELIQTPIFQQKSINMFKGLSHQNSEPDNRLICISSAKHLRYRIIHSEVNDFLSSPLISLGENPFQREGIILDPASSTLNLFYDIYTNLLADEYETLPILKILSNLFSRAFLHKAPEDISSVINWCVQENKADFLLSEKGEKCALIPLQAFLSKNTGVCRHRSLLACYIISRLIRDEKLTAREVRHVRGHIQGKGHTWVMIRLDENEWLHFDPQWNYILEFNENNMLFLNQRYTKEAIDAIKIKLNIRPENPELSLTASLSLTSSL